MRKYLFLILVFLLVSTTQAVTWSNGGGCWTAANGSESIVKWNATGPATYTIPTGVNSLKILVVGGGGGGAGSHVSGGGGAGGLIYNTTLNVTPNSLITLNIGAGGSGGSGSGTSGTGSNGTDSWFNTGAWNLSAKGGGGGGPQTGTPAPSGGSGGGAGSGGLTRQIGGSSTQPTTGISSGYGFAGGNDAAGYGSGGGGGANQIGQTGGSNAGGNGGQGLQYDITGDTTWYSCGGGGSGNSAAGGSGGCSAGGTGGYVNYPPAKGTGDNETGSGGGAGYYSQQIKPGYRGGDGIVIIRYTVVSPPVSSFVVKLTDTSNGNPSGWTWNATNLLGNNTPVTISTAQNPTVNLSPGNWVIQLTTSNFAGSNTSSNYTLGFYLQSPRVYYWNRTS